ncbi:hypothetical protein BO99DRAFT_352138 [Aspergillus violaceofuscus CBS 115571]|uniref:Zn(2)-C6 fungal-type domain-containing protein n=1 Tax=Aspergillus violaceofuscus (strain CBS 115571) TaxID=1450538 RepID=A0A2V5I3H5_ASPV1|nr:hypothetical protein BO99DRAFT_352138 [Aspergillus violaceofuscus CBS 115571]
MSTNKRKHDGVPHTMVQRLTPQPRLSCQNCRQKKWRCDRKHPCNNCKLRKVYCQFNSGLDSQDLPTYPARHGTASDSPTGPVMSPLSVSQTEGDTAPSLHFNNDESFGLVDRIRKLEEAVFGKGSTTHDTSRPAPIDLGPRASGFRTDNYGKGGGGTSFAKLSSSALREQIVEFDDCMQDPRRIVECLPPVEQARLLFDQFVRAIQPTLGVLHIPSVRVLMEETYRDISEGKEPNFTVVTLLLSIYAGSTLVVTSEPLESLKATEKEARTAFATFTRLAMTMLDYPSRPIAPSTVALLAITTLCHVLTHADGFSDKMQALRMRAIFMARSMQIHRLDSPKSQEERKRTGYEIVEIEVQRRIWWHIVSSDWIVSLSQGPQEGSYLLHPKHMRVNLPSNVDDESLATSGPDCGLPLTTPTSMSVFILRVQFAEICRQIVDAFSSIFLGENEMPEYDIVLDLDRRLHNVLDSMPKFLRLDPEHVQQSREIIMERPYLAWQRIVGHLGIYTRICRLHRPYHREASVNPRFAYSRQACLHFAQRILDLRRTMDEASSTVGMKPSNYWMVMQHVFFAAMVLASDVSMNPGSPGADRRKQDVLEACKMLEQSQRLSTSLTEAIQRNTQTLMSILQSTQKEQQQPPRTNPGAISHVLPTSQGGAFNTSSSQFSQGETTRRVSAAEADAQPLHFSNDNMTMGNYSMTQDATATNTAEEESWGQLWSDLFAVAPEIDDIQWDLLLNDWDLCIDTAF